MILIMTIIIITIIIIIHNIDIHYYYYYYYADIDNIYSRKHIILVVYAKSHAPSILTLRGFSFRKGSIIFAVATNGSFDHAADGRAA